MITKDNKVLIKQPNKTNMRNDSIVFVGTSRGDFLFLLKHIHLHLQLGWTNETWITKKSENFMKPLEIKLSRNYSQNWLFVEMDLNKENNKTNKQPIIILLINRKTEDNRKKTLEEIQSEINKYKTHSIDHNEIFLILMDEDQREVITPKFKSVSNQMTLPLKIGVSNWSNTYEKMYDFFIKIKKSQ